MDIERLYNNLRVYEDEKKRSSSSTSTSQNLAFLSSKNTSSINEVSTASGDFGVCTACGISQVSSTPCAQDVACSFFVQPTTSPQLKNEDFQQIDEDDLEELDLRWQVAMLTIREFIKKKRSGRNSSGKKDLMVTMAGAMHQQMNLHHREIKINNLNLELEKVVKEKKPLKLKIEKWEESSKNLDELLNSQMSARDKTVTLQPITGNFLTLRADISFAGLDEYAIRKKIIKSKTTDLNTKPSETVDDEDDVSEVQTVRR
ncbi:hypothetical protein Tco_0985569 [Tanacetum coccineum]